MNSSQGTVRVTAAPIDFGPALLLSNNSLPSSRSQSRGSFIRCTPTNLISPPSNLEQSHAITSGFLNQAHHMDMFGSHFKLGGASEGLEDLATPSANTEIEKEVPKI